MWQRVFADCAVSKVASSSNMAEGQYAELVFGANIALLHRSAFCAWIPTAGGHSSWIEREKCPRGINMQRSSHSWPLRQGTFPSDQSALQHRRASKLRVCCWNWTLETAVHSRCPWRPNSPFVCRCEVLQGKACILLAWAANSEDPFSLSVDLQPVVCEFVGPTDWPRRICIMLWRWSRLWVRGHIWVWLQTGNHPDSSFSDNLRKRSGCGSLPHRWKWCQAKACCGHCQRGFSAVFCGLLWAKNRINMRRDDIQVLYARVLFIDVYLYYVNLLYVYIYIYISFT